MVRLIIADDEMLERMLLYKILKKNLGDRCEICQAENGREVLMLYEERKAQILILDIEMPGITGIEAAEKIREADKECCIIFLTAFDEFAYAKKAITIRALDYLLKPFDEQELMLVVEEAVRRTEQRGDGIPRDPHGGGPDRGQHGEMPPEMSPGAAALPDGAEAARLGRVAEDISRYIQQNYVQDISMQELARKMNYSEAYFCKLFKQCFHKNFTAYLTEYRVKEAKKLLMQPTVNVKEAGRCVGYTDSGYFAKVFKRVTGMSPTEYRNEIFRNEP